MPPRYDADGYDKNGRRKIGFKPTETRDPYTGLDGYYALQNRALPAFGRPNGPASANDVAGMYRDQGMSIGPGGAITPRMYGAPQSFNSQARPLPVVNPTPIYNSDPVNSNSFAQEIARARQMTQQGLLPPAAMPTANRNAPALGSIASPTGLIDPVAKDPNSLLWQGGDFTTKREFIDPTQLKDVQSFGASTNAAAPLQNTDQASANRAGLELMRDAKRGNMVVNETADGRSLNSKYGSGSSVKMTPEQFANRPEATIEGMPASEWFKRSAARQNQGNKFSTVAQGQDFLGDERRKKKANV